MKKKNLKSLVLNKQKVSQLHEQIGGLPVTIDQPTISTCTCVSCLPGVGCNDTLYICPPPQTQFCTFDCVTQECTFITCPAPTGYDLP